MVINLFPPAANRGGFVLSHDNRCMCANLHDRNNMNAKTFIKCFIPACNL